MYSDHDVPLSRLTTMRLGGPARQVVTVTSKDELVDSIDASNRSGEPFFVLGGGSNVIARDQGFDGTIILNRITGFEVLAEDEESVTVRLGAGENWDETVAKLVGMGLSGVEAMSAIPGTVGATPVQNVGAYGQEIADTLVELEAYDTGSHEFTTLANEDCQFSYRDSIFKDPSSRHHVITHITLRLRREPMRPPFYNSLQNYLDAHEITDFSPASIRQAVIEIRREKLPDQSVIANTGSFFKNPIVDKVVAARLQNQFHDLPGYPMPDGRVKLAAGWLIEHAGLKGYAAHGMKTYEHNALVAVNETAKTYEDLLAFREEIVQKVREKYAVVLEQEPETL